MKWPVETIDVVAQVNPKLAAADRPDLDEIVCFVPMAAVSEETLSIEAQAERPFSEVAKGYTPFKRGDVLVAKITPCFENGKMAFADNLAHELGFGTTEFHVFRPSERITGPYLFNLLRAPYVRKAGAIKMRGAAGQRRVPADFFAALQIPLPPLDEQKRIAGILDAADALRAKRREALAELDTLLQSTFLDMFGDPVTNPMGWPPTSLSAISEELRDGPFGSNLKTSHYVESGVRVIRLQNIGVGEMRNDDLAFISEEHFASLPRNHCRPGDVIIGTMGDPNLRACIVPLALAHAINKADCILMRVDMTKVDAIYVCWLLNNPCMVSMARRLVRGQTRGRISLGRLKELQVHLPPIELQLRFAAIVESVEQQKASQRAHLAELDTLFASLQSRAFRGDL